jgi:arabinose-5-phosphate isomerase
MGPVSLTDVADVDSARRAMASIDLSSPVQTGDSSTFVIDPVPGTLPAQGSLDARCVQIARDVFNAKATAIRALVSSVDDSFAKAVRMILACQGRVVVAGVGKSGHVGRKIAATLASTGTPSLFIHATEAMHGDLGMVQPHDVAILVSYSGRTEEVLRMVEPLRRFGTPIIALTGDSSSALSRNSDCTLHVPVEREVCPNNLAPTTSTTCTIAMGDALAVALMQCRGFTSEDFANYHPGGALGRRVARVGERMRTDPPTNSPSDSLRAVLGAMTSSRLGLTVICDAGRIRGIITDGDIRRALERDVDMRTTRAVDLMTADPLTIDPNCTLADAEAMMRMNRVKTLIVSTDGIHLDGVIDLYGI